mmetsp:Transcript_41842/g.115318  ORF Transcript_41842/g.115318 Transcript_41842/m.115318 type:complete len:236 (-) Transcript_41842:1261-1968(-)
MQSVSGEPTTPAPRACFCLRLPANVSRFRKHPRFLMEHNGSELRAVCMSSPKNSVGNGPARYVPRPVENRTSLALNGAIITRRAPFLASRRNRMHRPLTHPAAQCGGARGAIPAPSSRRGRPIVRHLSRPTFHRTAQIVQPTTRSARCRRRQSPTLGAGGGWRSLPNRKRRPRSVDLQGRILAPPPVEAGTQGPRHRPCLPDSRHFRLARPAPLWTSPFATHPTSRRGRRSEHAC